MPQVENVLSAAGFSDAVVNAGFNRLRCSEEKSRVNISLHTNVIRQALQGFADVDGPVKRDDIHPCGCHSLEHTMRRPNNEFTYGNDGGFEAEMGTSLRPPTY